MAIKTKTIFIVDDAEMQSLMLASKLEENPLYKVHQFDTGEECLQKLSLNPDVIILDYELNSVKTNAQNGLAILEKIKKTDQTIPVIMLSSQSHYGKAVQTIVKGAIEYVVKDDQAFNKVIKIVDAL